MMQTTQQGWIIQWFNEQKRDKWKIGTPQFKYCKKRKDQYTSQFPLVWYKAPYKYHCHLEVENMSPDENVISYIDLNYEDGQKIIDAKHGSAISKNENYFIHHHIQTSSPLIRKFKSEVTLGPFQFNICSYKQDGRKFRMLIFLYVPFILGGIPQQPGVQTICCLISPPFIIRAKKPIVQPGIKKTVAKRKKQDETNQPKKKKRSKSPKKKNQEEVKKSLQQPTTSLIQSQQPIITSQMIEDFLDDFDNVEDNVENQPTLQPQFLSQPVQQLNVPQQNDPLESLLENDEDKVVELFKQLDQTRRKNLLTQLIEESFAHEKEFLFKKYFTGTMQNMTYQQYVEQKSQKQWEQATQSISSPIITQQLQFNSNLLSPITPTTNTSSSSNDRLFESVQQTESGCLENYFIDFVDC